MIPFKLYTISRLASLSIILLRSLIYALLSSPHLSSHTFCCDRLFLPSSFVCFPFRSSPLHLFIVRQSERMVCLQMARWCAWILGIALTHCWQCVVMYAYAHVFAWIHMSLSVSTQTCTRIRSKSKRTRVLYDTLLSCYSPLSLWCK